MYRYNIVRIPIISQEKNSGKSSVSISNIGKGSKYIYTNIYIQGLDFFSSSFL